MHRLTQPLLLVGRSVLSTMLIFGCHYIPILTEPEGLRISIKLKIRGDFEVSNAMGSQSSSVCTLYSLWLNVYCSVYCNI